MKSGHTTAPDMIDADENKNEKRGNKKGHSKPDKGHDSCSEEGGPRYAMTMRDSELGPPRARPHDCRSRAQRPTSSPAALGAFLQPARPDKLYPFMRPPFLRISC